MKLMRIDEGLIVEIVMQPDMIGGRATKPEDFFPPENGFVLAPDGVEIGMVQRDGKWVRPAALLPTKDALRAYAAARRYAVEVGGVTVGDLKVATDDRSKTLILGAQVAASTDAGWTTVWRDVNGAGHAINPAQMLAISDAVQAHVNASFKALDTVLADIDSGKLTTFAQIDAAIS